MDIIAMYLPQFHRVRENDEWWGEGFTEWTTVKNATPLFDGHVQPRVPLNGYYYDLLDKNTMLWQADLAKEYGVDGFCFYHYWFKDGRQILEKPAEELLNWHEINMPFCFCWAAATWARSWTNIPGKNSWADKYEKASCASTGNGVLLEQKFGDEEQWKEHFDYLIRFFRDDRYIKEDGKPVFVIDATGGMPCLERMIIYWRKLASERNLPGLYIVVMNTGILSDGIADARISSMNIKNYSNGEYTNGVCRADYDEVYAEFLKSIPLHKEQPLLWGIVDYDDTPRRGKNGKCFTGSSPEKFERNLKSLINKSNKLKAPFLFLNAWNEWGEGMYLEPDQINGYGYLQAVKNAKSDTNTSAEWTSDVESIKNDLIQKNTDLEWQKRNYEMMLSWVRLKNSEGSLATYLRNKGIMNVAVYGYGMHGRLLADDLIKSNYPVQYAIDQKADGIVANIPVYNPNGKMPETDLIIISVLGHYNSICSTLKELVECPIVELDELLCEALAD